MRVSLELALLVDVSASVSKEEYARQVLGLADAFKSEAVLNAIRNSKGVAVSVMPWAQEAYQYNGVDWTLLENDADAHNFANKVAAMKRRIPSGQTAIGNALAYAQKELNQNGFDGMRQVIDLSGDGRTNDGKPMDDARLKVLEHGTTINALAIVNEMSDLAEYFEKHLIGGPGAFVVFATDYTDFARAIRFKLAREINGLPVASSPLSEGFRVAER